ncbi:MAG: Porphobilinogen deaminase (EC [uncultured Campylobacterales bacterium]|uniref:Porphobilinogen deaminase n=1 Tax=uncultured Campylobacterales bacterium TaxID=352960 RepID=A0A6S6SMP0_9BACT|nr:MAG: Porphobilinogen deaminase (EC [uncultured Campylobacterales bacterium]
MEINIASRASKLALWQSYNIQKQLKDKYNCEVTVQEYSTRGDEILDRSLAAIGGKGLFTKELEIAILNGKADIAVHSLKDIPVVLPESFMIGAITTRADVRDMFLSQKYETLDNLPKNSVVGTTSQRRKLQLLLYRPDLIIKDLRGNVNTRIQKLKNSEYDAIILACAGIDRLELSDEVKYTHRIDKNIMVPAMGQASLAIECLVGNEEKIKFLNDEKAFIETTIERDFVRYLEGGCQTPIGINACLIDDKIEILAIVGGVKSMKYIKQKICFDKKYYKEAGASIAKLFITLGAKELLEEAI